MAKAVTKYSIFVASPSDLEDERTAVDEVVKELNGSYGASKNIVLDVVKWETNSAPGFSKGHVQDLIDEDIGMDYDLFLGMLWTRFGTPTDKAGSGTEQEFLNAVKRFRSGSSSMQILFYFKDSAPKSLAEINAAQLLKIEEFKKSIHSQNGLTWNFDTVENLKNFLRIHIPKRIESITNSVLLPNKIEVPSETDNSDEEFDDLGLLEYSELYENYIGDSTNSLTKIAESTSWIGGEINTKADELTRAAQVPNPKKDVINAILTRTAKLMNDYTSRLEIEIPIFYENFSDGIEAGSKLMNIAEDFYSGLDDLQETKEAISVLKEAIPESIKAITSFYTVMKDFPRIQKDINQSKRRLLLQLDDLIDKLNKALDLAEEFYSEIIVRIAKLQDRI